MASALWHSAPCCFEQHHCQTAAAGTTGHVIHRCSIRIIFNLSMIACHGLWHAPDIHIRPAKLSLPIKPPPDLKPTWRQLRQVAIAVSCAGNRFCCYRTQQSSPLTASCRSTEQVDRAALASNLGEPACTACTFLSGPNAFCCLLTTELRDVQADGKLLQMFWHQ
jgi:hypothetical protein